MSFIPYARQSISREDLEAVFQVLQSDWLTQGPVVEKFERAVAERCGADFALAVCNGTAALHLACLALELGPGKRLWTSPNTFVASANCARFCGAEVDFVDIDPRTYNLSVEQLDQKLHRARSENRLPDVVVPVHFSGQPCFMEEIGDLSRRYGFKIIEDAAHALGASYKGEPVGNGRHSDLTILSFHPVKMITTAEGGMVITNRKDFYQKLLRLRIHGITREPSLMRGESHGPWYYQQLELGWNYRMTELQAALGLSQLNRLEQFLERRRFLAARYDELLKGLPLTLPWQHPDGLSSYHLYVVRLRQEICRKTHRQVFEQLRAAGFGVNIHYIPVHTQPYYQDLGFKAGDFPESEKYYSEAITLPLFVDFKEKDQDRVVNVLKEILAG